jgi:hypothetical protein
MLFVSPLTLTFAMLRSSLSQKGRGEFPSPFIGEGVGMGSVYNILVHPANYAQSTYRDSSKKLLKNNLESL